MRTLVCAGLLIFGKPCDLRALVFSDRPGQTGLRGAVGYACSANSR